LTEAMLNHHQINRVFYTSKSCQIRVPILAFYTRLATLIRKMKPAGRVFLGYGTRREVETSVLGPKGICN
jgi:hypothetical protein